MKGENRNENLIIEDEDDLRHALSRGLTKLNDIVDTASSGDEGLDLAQSGTYDLILLYLNLPGKDGLDILKAIREVDWSQKILILSARSAVSQRVEGLDLGANEYLVKPFDFGELVSRINNLLRRNFTQLNTVLTYEGLSLDAIARIATANGETINLSPKEFAILEYLLCHQGRPISAEELIDHAWSEDEADLFSNAIKVQISLLRKKLQIAGFSNVIQTIRGVGYLIGKDEVDYE